MIDGIYHQDVFMPPLRFSDEPVKLTYTAHAQGRVARIKDGAARMPSHINLSEADVIELEVRGRRPYKGVFRVAYDVYHDITYVIDLRGMRVITVWLNWKGDNHSTLDKTKYTRR